MESVLHIEAVHRPVTAPFSIGQYEFLYYGERPTSEEDGEPLGEAAGYIRLGSPVHEMDGSVRSHIPFIKTLECMPCGVTGRYVYLDTVHFVTDQQYLIPVRSKIHTGPSAGVRVAHLPSLNYLRRNLTGEPHLIRGCNEEMITHLLEHDAHFLKNARHPITEWIRDDLVHAVSTNPVVPVSFSKEYADTAVREYLREVKDTPYELNRFHLNSVARRMSLVHETIPSSYWSQDVIARPLLEARRKMATHSHDFSFGGRLKTESLPCNAVNHLSFQWLAEILDTIPLSDFNVDMVVDLSGTVVLYHENFATNRFAVFADAGVGYCPADTVVMGIFTEQLLTDFFNCLVKHHPSLSEENAAKIINQPIKLKVVKTIRDEAAVVVYEANSVKGAEPLCALTFDLALSSLAPMTVVEDPIGI